MPILDAEIAGMIVSSLASRLGHLACELEEGRKFGDASMILVTINALVIETKMALVDAEEGGYDDQAAD